MKFYEFNPNAYKTQDDIATVAKNAAGATARTASKGTGIVGSTLKGAAKFAGMFAKDFDPALKPFYQDSNTTDAPGSKYDLKKIEEYKKVLVDFLRDAPLYAPDRVILQKSIGNSYTPKMRTPEYKLAIQKILAGKQLDGKEIVLIKEIVAEL